MPNISKANDSLCKVQIKFRKESQFVESPRQFRWKHENNQCKS
jgi:hypothetical protein